MTSRPALDAARREIAFSFERGTSLCTPFLAITRATGASISFLGASTAHSTICASDETAAHLDELQFDLGEGPCWEAMRSHLPALHSHIQDEDEPTWPEFARAIKGRPVGAMFAFPLLVSSLEIGAVDLYTAAAGAMSTEAIADASSLASLAAWQVLRRVLTDQEDTSDEGSIYSRREVHQATGMVIAQLDVTAEDALLLLRAHAFSRSLSVREIAAEIVERRLSFRPQKDSGNTPPGALK
ncbi:GAF and ANTAR domain-containing protein [Lacisediminihabitans sp. FW035]